MKGSAENIIQRRQSIQMTLNAIGNITLKQIRDRFDIGKTQAKEDIAYFKNWKVIEWNNSEKRYDLIDQPRSLPGLFISQNEWLAFTFTEKLLEKHSTSFSKELEKFRERYKKDMKGLLPMTDVTKYFSTSFTKMEKIEDTIFETCLYAVVNRAAMKITYHKPYEDQPEEREISPHHFLNIDGRWILISWDHRKKELRNFMPSRIKSIQMGLTLNFELQSYAIIKKHLNESYGDYVGSRKLEATLLFSEKKSFWAEKQSWHSAESKKWVGKRLRLTLPIASEEGILEEVLSHGSDVEVLLPERLKDLVKMKIVEMQNIYT
jgi:predicted DNA-binding transcriptional regulator YafY